MNGEGRRDRQGRGTLVVAVAGTVLALGGLASMLLRGRPAGALYDLWVFHNVPTAVLGVWLGRLVLLRRRRNPAGLVLLAIGTLSCLHVAAITLADARMVAAGLPGLSPPTPLVPADLPLDATLPLWASAWLWIPVAGLALTVLLLLFPDGALPSPRWRGVAGMALGATAVLVVAYAIEMWPGTADVRVPAGQVESHAAAVALLTLAGPVLALCAAASIGSLVMRWRRAGPGQRERLRPVVVTGIGMVAVLVLTWPWQWLWIPLGLVSIWAFLAAYGFSVARYRIHDLDVVLNRAVVAAVLAAVVAGVYLAIVVGVGTIVERGTERTMLGVLAAGVVAVLFAPAQRRVSRLVDRLLYNRDRDAEQVLTQLADRLGTTSSPAGLLDEVTELLVASTGTERAEIVAIAGPGERRLIAERGASASTAPVLVAPVLHQGERLGAVRLYGRAATDLPPDAPDLVAAVAGTLGVVLRNTQLTAELQAQVKELQRSRARLVHAHDDARRALERDIHDGAQARLVTLRMRIGLAADLAARGATGELETVLGGLGHEVDAAVAALRSLAHGLHPPVLEGGGVVAALRAEVRGMPFAVTVAGDGVGRYDKAVEAAVYFSCLEAIQNAVKHGGARSVTVGLTNGTGGLRFTVADDGSGFDPVAVPAGAGLTNVRDRLSALGGTLTVDAGPGRGTVISGQLPAQPVSASGTTAP